jgi:hypothetical protein
VPEHDLASFIERLTAALASATPPLVDLKDGVGRRSSDVRAETLLGQVRAYRAMPVEQRRGSRRQRLKLARELCRLEVADRAR